MIEYVTSFLSFFGFTLDVVDFAGGGDQQDRPQSLSHVLPLLSLLVLLADCGNYVLDAFFIKKLYKDGEEDLYFMMLLATASTFAVTMVFGKILLQIIKNFNPDDFNLADMATFLFQYHYMQWGYIEASAFLVEDAATIYIYYAWGADLEELTVLDKINICTSLLSGILASVILVLMLCAFYVGTEDGCKLSSMGFASLFFTGYAAYVAIFGIFQGNEITDDSGLMAFVVAMTFVTGALLQVQIVCTIPRLICCGMPYPGGD